MKRQTVDDGPMVPILSPAVDMNWLPGVARNTFCDVEYHYRRCRGRVDENAGQPGDVLADLVDDFDDIFGQEAL